MRKSDGIITTFFLSFVILSWSGCTVISKNPPSRTSKTSPVSRAKDKKVKTPSPPLVSNVKPQGKGAPQTGDIREKEAQEQVREIEALIQGMAPNEKGKPRQKNLLPTDEVIKLQAINKIDQKRGQAQKSRARKKPPTRKSTRFKGGQESIRNVVLNFDNADIYEVIKTIAGILDLNYIIDPAVKGTVNIHTKGMIFKQDLFDIFQAILKVNGASAIKEGDLYQIVPTQSIKTRLLIPKVGQERAKMPSQDKVILQVLHLDFISATEAGNALRPFITPGAEITVYEKNNLLLITDFSKNIYKLLKIIALLDVNLFERASLKLYPLEEANVQEVSQEMQKIFSALNVPTTSGKGIGINFIPIKRINALLVVTTLPQALEEVSKWLNALDKSASTDELRTFIYHVKNGISGELADILNAVFTTKNDRERPEHRNRRTEPFVKTPASKQEKPVGGRKGITQGVNLPLQSRISGDIKIIPYATTNTIIIKASPRDHRVIMKVLSELDALQRQVLIDILIAELTLSDSTAFGIEAASRGPEVSAGVQRNLFGSSLGLTAAGTLASGGFTASTIQGDFLAVLNALASENRVNVLASPHIIAADGKEASIDIGDEVPLIASRIFIDQRQELTIERRNTGVILKVKPHINATGLVTLDISLELSDASQAVVEGESDIRIFKRNAKTTMIVQNGQTIIIGGLISEKKEQIETKVPFLGDIPFLGWLFKNKKNVLKKTELVLLITPHVIQSLDDAKDVTNEFVSGLQAIQKRVEEQRKKSFE